MHKTYLGQKGYTIHKDSLTIKEQVFIREQLMVKPYLPKSPIQQESFPIYRESGKKLYVPRIFGINLYGVPNEYKITNGDPIDIKFNGTLRSEQQVVVDKFLDVVNMDKQQK